MTIININLYSPKLLYRYTMKTKEIQTPTIYPFEVTTIEGEAIKLDQFKDKVLLIVNTASECGFTPQYKELEELYKRYRNQGFEVLAFPSNDFGKQEPLDGKSIEAFCSLHFRTTFPVFEKVVVNGRNTIPLYQFLSNKSQNGKVNISPKWNFHKYLINRQGEVVDFFFPFTKPNAPQIRKAIERWL